MLLAVLPIQTDPEVATLRAQIVGRRIWLKGATVWLGIDRIVVWDPRAAATVLDVRRETDPKRGFNTLSLWDIASNWDLSSVRGERPIRITVRLPDTRDYAEAPSIFVRRYKPSDPLRPKGTPPQTASIRAEDAAEFWRIAWPTSPWPELRASSAKVQNAFTSREVAVGMPRSLVARLLGEPSLQIGKEASWAMRQWEYWGMAPFYYAVVFGPDGRVSSCGMGGDLP